MPRLICTYDRFLEIIFKYGFVFHRQGTGSHVRYRGEIGGSIRYVDVAGHNSHDEIPIGTLKSMIRQSGLSPKLFRI